jgi:hypothetical protein
LKCYSLEMMDCDPHPWSPSVIDCDPHPWSPSVSLTVSHPCPLARLEKSCVVQRCSSGMRSRPERLILDQWDRSTSTTPLEAASTA